MVIKLLIVCEGVIDQSLLGCYIEDISDLKYCKKLKNNPFANENITWYTNNYDELLGIWSNGGDDFTQTLEEICRRELYEKSIEKLLIITDNDDEKAENQRINNIYNTLKLKLSGVFEIEEAMLNKYNRITWEGNFGNEGMDIGYLLVPLEGHGAMETFMLEALSENMPEKESVITQVKSFINTFESDAYLLHRRDKVKAELGVSLSIMNPDKSFTIMKELVDMVDWKKYKATYKQFEIVRESL